MTTHRILVEQTSYGWRAWHAHASLGVVSTPVYGVAKLLLELGMAHAPDALEVFVERDGGEDIIGRTIIGAGARLAIQVA